MAVAEYISFTSPPVRDLSDHVLIHRTLAGDQRAFELLVQRYHPLLQSFIRRTLRDPEQTLDVLQHVLLQLHRFLPQLAATLPDSPNKAPLKAWLFRVATNRCIQEMRKKRPLLFCELEPEVCEDDEEWSLLDMLADKAPQPDQVAEFNELEDSLQQAIATLPPKVQKVVLLRYQTQLTFVEIGRVLNMPENTVKTYFMRARPRLRAALSR